MKTLKSIYEIAGLEFPNIYKKELDKYKPAKENRNEYKMPNGDIFYSSKNIFNEIAKHLDDYKTHGESMSEEKTVYNEIYYSSKIEGIKIDKISNIKEGSNADLMKEAYKFLLSQNEIQHETLETIVSILSKANDQSFEKLSDDNKSYRKNTVGIYKSGPYMQDVLVHEGVKPEDINSMMEESFKGLNWIEEGPDANVPAVIATAAISHLIFEYIHPYYDGNGRIGRMLMYWFLRRTKSPEFSYHMSQIIDANRSKYYQSLEHSQKTKNFDYFIAYMFNVCWESMIITFILQPLSVNYSLTNSQVDFLKKLLISGIHEREITYSMVKEYFNDTHTKPAFFKMINLLVDKGVIGYREEGKTIKYFIQKDEQ